MSSMLKIRSWSTSRRQALTATEIVAGLAKLQGWSLSGDGEDVSIEKSFSFLNYFETMAFVNAVALIAHQQDHHPELVVGFKQCKVRFSTHDVRGLSRSDFDCASRVDGLLFEVDA